MLNDLKRIICKANKELARQDVVRFTWGNVSGFDPSMGLFVIKPSGVPYEDLQPEMMIVMSMDGQKVEGRLNPSSDYETHRAIYMSWPMTVGAIAHTHSTFATAFAQAGEPIPVLGTTHADYFNGNIPVTRELTDAEITENYEWNVGQVVVEAVNNQELIPGALVRGRGVFAWGADAMTAVVNAVVLEDIAHTAFLTRELNTAAKPISAALQEKHFTRKNTPGGYYGQTLK